MKLEELPSENSARENSTEFDQPKHPPPPAIGDIDVTAEDVTINVVEDCSCTCELETVVETESTTDTDSAPVAERLLIAMTFFLFMVMNVELVTAIIVNTIAAVIASWILSKYFA